MPVPDGKKFYCPFVLSMGRVDENVRISTRCLRQGKDPDDSAVNADRTAARTEKFACSGDAAGSGKGAGNRKAAGI